MTIEYYRQDGTIEIIVRDYGKAKIESHKCNIKDSKKAGKIMQYLKDKYGFTPTIDLNSSVGFEDNAEGEKENKVDWWA